MMQFLAGLALGGGLAYAVMSRQEPGAQWNTDPNYKRSLGLEGTPNEKAHYANAIADPLRYTLGEHRRFIAHLLERGFPADAGLLSLHVKRQQAFIGCGTDATSRRWCSHDPGRFLGSALPPFSPAFLMRVHSGRILPGGAS